MLKLIVGLGNPGSRYEWTRHNAGFWVVDAVARQLDAVGWRRWMSSEALKTILDGEPVLLAKPQTFMNLSGDAVYSLARYYRVEPKDILVVYDDLDLPEGMLRVRAQGGAGGHRGMQSIITALGSSEFPRIRIGIGRPPANVTSAEYVLRTLTKAQRAAFEPTVAKAVEAVRTWVGEGVVAAMNKYNGAMQ